VDGEVDEDAHATRNAVNPPTITNEMNVRNISVLPNSDDSLQLGGTACVVGRLDRSLHKNSNICPLVHGEDADHGCGAARFRDSDRLSSSRREPRAPSLARCPRWLSSK
jgi:hypothetical protein